MRGNHQGCHHIVFVAVTSWWNMPSVAQEGLYHQSDTMTWGTWQQTCSLKYVPMSPLNLTFNPWQEKLWTYNYEDGACLDVSALGFWGDRHECAFFDVRVFNLFAASNCRASLNATYTCHENIEKRSYERRDKEVEYGSFTLSIWRYGTSCNNHLQETGLTDIK